MTRVNPPSRKGIKMSPESREKMRKNNAKYWLGKKILPHMKEALRQANLIRKRARGEGTPNWNGGKPNCIDCKVQIGYRSKRCNKCMGIYRSGSKSPFWKGGITPENKKLRLSSNFRAWREAVFARDNWTDQKTGIRGGKLHPHHIKNFSEFPELRFAVDNGITLSEKSHKQFHRKYGTRNNTREQIEEFLKK